MNCSYCGNQLNSEEQFCPVCGAKQNNSTKSNIEKSSDDVQSAIAQNVPSSTATHSSPSKAHANANNVDSIAHFELIFLVAGLILINLAKLTGIAGGDRISFSIFFGFGVARVIISALHVIAILSVYFQKKKGEYKNRHFLLSVIAVGASFVWMWFMKNIFVGWIGNSDTSLSFMSYLYIIDALLILVTSFIVNRSAKKM